MGSTLIDREASLRRAVDYIPEAIAVFDRDLRLATANLRYRELLNVPKAMVASGTRLYDIALFLGRRGDLGPGDAVHLAARRVETLTQSQATVTQRMGADGQVLEFHSCRLPDGGLVISFADVTARVDAESQLARVNQTLEGRVEERTAALTQVNSELEEARAKADAANRDKTRFLAAASHDLLQPLNAARLYTATLVERAGGTGLDELAHAIEASLTAVEEIMSALLDISRIDSGAFKPVPTAFKVHELLQKIAVEFAPMARRKDIDLRVVQSSATIISDRTLLARIVQNLASNAVKYTRPGGRVLVGARIRGNRLRLDVIDTGIGFSREQQGLIFAEFSRLDAGAKMAQGLGLGLSIVKRLVAALGLTLELDSREGKGSRFSLYLPLTRAIEQAPETAPVLEPNASLAGVRILCVDNERAILDAMDGLLSGWGCDVRLARSLKDIDKDRLLVGWLPDLVLMDYHLDQTSGLDAIQWLRHNVGGHLPAALVTADRGAAVRALAEEREVQVVTKPVKPAALRAMIGGLVGQQKRKAPAAE